MENFDLVIVGGGPIGLFSAFYAGRRNMKTLIVEAADVLGGLPYTIYPEKWILDVPGFPLVTGYDLSKRLVEQAQSDMVTVKTQATILSYEGSLEAGFKINYIEDGVPGQLSARTILLATGVGKITPRTLDVPGEETLQDRGVHYFIGSTDIVRGKRVVVVGGGDSALDWVDLMQGEASDIHLVHRRAEFRAQEESVRRLMDSAAQLHLNAEVSRIVGDEQVTSVEVIYKDGRLEVIPCDVVIIAFGFRVELGSLNDWGLEMDKGYVVVNHSMETNIPGIFAAGDVTCSPGIGSTKLLAIGFAQGTIAVNMAKMRSDSKAAFFPGHSTNWK
jgi:ferredoxin/flavodoxin---NADP+ reductase